jgi:hypothetical protein
MLKYANQQLNSAARTVTYAALQQRAGRSVKDPVGLLRERNVGPSFFEAGAVHILLGGPRARKRPGWQRTDEYDEYGAVTRPRNGL